MRFRFALVALFAVALPAAAIAQNPAFNWGPAPGVFPAGAKMAVVQGNPGESAIFTVRLDFPDGYRIAPHFHPTDEYITVISGTFLVGMGDSLDAAHTTTLTAGGFVTAPATMHHYAIARGRTVVQVNGMGPFALIYVNPKDDPSHMASAH